MIDFLKNCNISNDVIKDVERTYSKANLYSLNNNEYEVYKIIEYFRRIGIKYIDELLVYQFSVFLHSFADIKKLFNKYGENDLVKKINDDYLIMDELLEELY
ncbi:MAG: hypothetical protein VZS44_04130 [Bacilli bacterium]|nr:hypothetical protein [Bacilli bacterium]